MTTDRRPVTISVYPILSVSFVGALGFSIVLPFLVFLVTRWGGNALVYGVMGATYSAFQLVGAPILGRWSDRWGRRRILLASQAGTLLSWVIFVAAFLVDDSPLAIVDSTVLGSFTLTLPLIIMFLARAFDGLTGGNVSVANAYLADITRDEDRSANFGRMAVATNVGFIIGPALAGLLGATRFGEMLPVLAALFISVIATLIILFKLRESSPREIKEDIDPHDLHKVFGQEQRDCYEVREASALSIRDMLRLECIPTLLAIYFLVMLGFNFFYIAFPVYAATRLQWDVTDTGVFFSVLSGLMVVVQGPVLSRVSKRFADGALALAGGLVLSLSFVFFCFADMSLIYAGAALLALGNGLMWPSVLAILSRKAGRHQGAVQGFAGSCGAVASILGLLAGGVIYERITNWIFLISAVVIAVVVLLSLRFVGNGVASDHQARHSGTSPPSA